MVWKGAKGIAHKGHREKVLKVMSCRAFSGCFQGIFVDFEGIFSVWFRVFFPMPFPGMPFGPFQMVKKGTRLAASEKHTKLSVRLAQGHPCSPSRRSCLFGCGWTGLQ